WWGRRAGPPGPAGAPPPTAPTSPASTPRTKPGAKSSSGSFSRPAGRRDTTDPSPAGGEGSGWGSPRRLAYAAKIAAIACEYARRMGMMDLFHLIKRRKYQAEQEPRVLG